jgi:GMP synthase (glutamine-hydrolysing)
MSNKTALAIRHVTFEDLGSVAASLQRADYRIEYLEACEDDLTAIDPLAADLLIVLGGPIGVYDEASYPIVSTEADILKRRMDADMPTLGICLGAQLMAHALGSRVYPGPQKEIGWSAIDLTSEGHGSSLRHLEGCAVLHWHGDTFDLPEGCDGLASTVICKNQAFSRGSRILGLQFHPEVKPAKFEHWLIGHACELSQAGIDPRALRTDTLNHAERLVQASGCMFEEWLSGIR